MSTVKSKKLQVGTDASASNNFTIYQPSTPDGTLRIGVGNADSPTEVAQFNSNGYVATKAPAFSAYASSNQSISNATWTAVQCNAEEFDLTSDFDTSTYRFTPTVAGYYQVSAAVTFNYTAAADKAFLVYIAKNGSVAKYGNKGSSTGIVYPGASASCLIYLNGTTDYINFYAYQNTGGASSAVGLNTDTYFQAYLARAV